MSLLTRADVISQGMQVINLHAKSYRYTLIRMNKESNSTPLERYIRLYAYLPSGQERILHDPRLIMRTIATANNYNLHECDDPLDCPEMSDDLLTEGQAALRIATLAARMERAEERITMDGGNVQDDSEWVKTLNRIKEIREKWGKT